MLEKNFSEAALDLTRYEQTSEKEKESLKVENKILRLTKKVTNRDKVFRHFYDLKYSYKYVLYIYSYILYIINSFIWYFILLSANIKM